MPPRTRATGRNAGPRDPEPLDSQQVVLPTAEPGSTIPIPEHGRETITEMIPEYPQETAIPDTEPQNTSEQRSTDVPINPEDLPDEALDAALQNLMREENRLLKIQRWHELKRRTDAQRARLGRPQERSEPISTSDRSTPFDDRSITTGHDDTPASHADLPIRPNAWTASDDTRQNVKPPPNAVNIPSFQAINSKEYESFINKLENYFLQFDYFFALSDKNKVTSAAAHLSTELMNRWMRENKHLRTARTWDDFKQFCRKETSDPKVTQRDAAAAYHRAHQRENQNVSEFANYLDSLEDQLPERYTNDQRKMHLYAKLRPEVQRESQRSAQEPEFYTEYISWLRSCEDQIPERRSALRAMKRDGTRPNDSRDRQPSGFREGPQGTKRNFKRKRNSSRDNTNRQHPTCWKCHKGRHPPEECRSAPWKRDNGPKN